MANAASANKKPLLATLPGLVAACLFACLLWGSAFPCIKIGYKLFTIDSADTASIIMFAGMRFLISGVLAITGMSIAQHRFCGLTRRDLFPAANLSLYQTILQYLLFYMGLSSSSGVTSSIVEASNTFLTVLLAVFIFRSEHLSGKKAVGCLIGFSGVLLVNLGKMASGLSFALDGEGLVFLSTFAAATSSNLSKRYSKGHDPVLLSGWQFIIGGAVLLVTGLAFGGHVAPAKEANPAVAVTLLIYMGFISAAAYSLWSTTLAVNPVSRVAVFGFMNPVFGVILSAIFLGETDAMDPLLAIAALILVSLGVVIVNRPEHSTSS